MPEDPWGEVQGVFCFQIYIAAMIQSLDFPADSIMEARCVMALIYYAKVE